MDETTSIYSLRNEKPPFSRVGWTLFAVLGITTFLQIAIASLTVVFAPAVYEKSWFIWALSFIPLYFVAIPVGYLMIRPVPVLTVPQQKIGFGKLISYLAMSFAVMYIGNIIGTLLNAGIGELKGTELTNPLEELMTGSDIYIEMLVIVIIAPILEELMFRKVLIDRIRVYGEGTAILVSGLMFGLFHGNLFQFFYAFGLGALFAYIYLRTGRVRYTMILHTIINGFGVLMAQLVSRSSDIGTLGLNGENPEKLIEAAERNLPQYIAVGLCGIAALTLFISGIVLLIANRKKAVLFITPKELPADGRFKIVFVNWGMGLFVLLSVGLMVYTALA
ncbi:MAG: type II CAAX endopeptidase family protein [Oscillospiraceae bacterium]|nr:type II CAAX endopeptidase family protein [Oscillospiraceae bacterium]